MIHIRNAEVANVNLYESHIIGLEWENEGRDIVLHVDWNGEEKYKDTVDFMLAKTKLVFEFATHLRVHFEHDEHNQIGPIEMGEMVINKGENEWLVQIEARLEDTTIFALRCYSIHFYCED